MVNTQSSKSQADESDSDSSVFSFSVTTPIVGHSWEDEWILDTGTTYHACPNRGWFSSFEKLEGVRSLWAMITHVAGGCRYNPNQDV